MFYRSLTLYLFLAGNILFCQPSAYDDFYDRDSDSSTFRIVFWNVENFFDYEDDSLTRDDAFTPDGANHWTSHRFWKKKNHISKTLLATGGWDAPDIIALAEIENERVMRAIFLTEPLASFPYQIVHQDSRDPRGIDVALAYRKDRFTSISSKYLTVPFSDTTVRTRDILFLKGSLPTSDTINLLINHWPSRYGGRKNTDVLRRQAARFLRGKIESLLDQGQHVVVTGDFNDYPDDLSIREDLIRENSDDRLINLMSSHDLTYGTHSFQGKWANLDQFIVSSSLKGGSPELAGCMIFNAPWLLKQNAAGNTTTFRTYQGPAYQGGFSDHLPIILDLRFNQTSSLPSNSF